jgi:hypothetical protein
MRQPLDTAYIGMRPGREDLMVQSLLKSYARTLRFTKEAHSLNFPTAVEKREIIKSFVLAGKVEVFIETGTYLGHTVEAVAPLVSRAISIEIDKDLADKARHRLAASKNVTILHGDSAKILPDLVRDLDRPAVFWLDGHYSSGVTGGDPDEPPILRELDCVLSQQDQEHVILIDDARLFTGRRGYPTIAQLVAYIRARDTHRRINVYADIIRIHNFH